MDEVTAWISAEGRLPRDRSGHKDERWMARWLSDRRREAAEGTLDLAYRDGLARVPEWAGNHRAAADEARWHDRLAELVDFRREGNDWPGHHDYESEREHILGVWIHAQRYKCRRGELGPARITLPDEAVPGWQAGRTRGRAPRRRPVRVVPIGGAGGALRAAHSWAVPFLFIGMLLTSCGNKVTAGPGTAAPADARNRAAGPWATKIVCVP